MTPEQKAHWDKLEARIDELKGSIDLLNKKHVVEKTMEEINTGTRLYVKMLELGLAQRLLEGTITQEAFEENVQYLRRVLL
jgi:hypothetical protein